jgi:hypothetical protein
MGVREVHHLVCSAVACWYFRYHLSAEQISSFPARTSTTRGGTASHEHVYTYPAPATAAYTHLSVTLEPGGCCKMAHLVQRDVEMIPFLAPSAAFRETTGAAQEVVQQTSRPARRSEINFRHARLWGAGRVIACYQRKVVPPSPTNWSTAGHAPCGCSGTERGLSRLRRLSECPSAQTSSFASAGLAPVNLKVAQSSDYSSLRTEGPTDVKIHLTRDDLNPPARDGVGHGQHVRGLSTFHDLHRPLQPEGKFPAMHTLGPATVCPPIPAR